MAERSFDREKGYGLYCASAGSRFVLCREGLEEEYDRLSVTEEDIRQWNLRLLHDCREKRKNLSGEKLTGTYYTSAAAAKNSGDICLMLETAKDVACLYQEVLETKSRKEDSYTLMLTAEYVLNACAEGMNRKFPMQARKMGEVLLALLEALETEPPSADESYRKKPYMGAKLTEESLRKRLEDDKWAVRKYLLGEADE